MHALGYLPIVVIIIAFVALSARNRKRQALAEQQRRERIHVGSEVMTTSGLYGRVVAVNGDDTVMLSIAPGVEVRWAVAALRDPASVPSAYRRPTDSRVDMRKAPEARNTETRPDGRADGTATA